MKQVPPDVMDFLKRVEARQKDLLNAVPLGNRHTAYGFAMLDTLVDSAPGAFVTGAEFNAQMGLWGGNQKAAREAALATAVVNGMGPNGLVVDGWPMAGFALLSQDTVAKGCEWFQNNPVELEILIPVVELHPSSFPVAFFLLPVLLNEEQKMLRNNHHQYERASTVQHRRHQLALVERTSTGKQ